MKSLPRSLSVCAVEYEDQGSWVKNTLEKPVAAFLAAVNRLRSVGQMWVMDADLAYTGRGPLEPLFALLKDADMAVHQHKNPEAWRGRDQLVSAGVVGFAPTVVGFTVFAWWCYACLSYKPEGNHVRFPEQALLAEAVLVAEQMGGKVASIPTKYNARPQSADPRPRMFDLPDDQIVLEHVPASRVERARKG